MCLGSASNLQFAKDIRDVVAYCLWTEYQLFSNRWIGVALCDEHEYFTLALGQIVAFDTSGQLSADTLLRAVNARLPSDVRVIG